MNAPNRTSTPVSVLSAVGFAALGAALLVAARGAGYGVLPAALMSLLLAGGGWFGLHTVLARPAHPPVRRSGHALLWTSLLFLLVGAAVLAVRPEPATWALLMQVVSGCLPLVGLALYWNVLARKRAAEG